MSERKTIRVVAGLIRRGDRVLATRRGLGAMEGGWEFPGGKIETGETPQAALARELREELALETRVGALLCTAEHDYPAFHLSMDCLWCEPLSEFTLREHTDARWLSPEELEAVDWLPADREVARLVREALTA